MRAKRAIRGLCLIGAAVALFGCGSGDDAGGPGATRDVMPSPESSRTLGKEQVRAALPEAGDVPAGWEKSGTLRLLGASPEKGLVALGTQGYAATDLEGIVGFGVQSFQTRADAIEGYTMVKSQLASAQIGPVQIPDADAAFAASYCQGKDRCSTRITVRLDSVVAYVNINTDGPAAADAKILNSVTRMLAQRVRQAQSGQTPSARAV